MQINITHLKKIVRLSRLSLYKLKKMNPDMAYNGKGLTKYQLIYQIIFLMDAPIK